MFKRLPATRLQTFRSLVTSRSFILRFRWLTPPRMTQVSSELGGLRTLCVVDHHQRYSRPFVVGQSWHSPPPSKRNGPLTHRVLFILTGNSHFLFSLTNVYPGLLFSLECYTAIPVTICLCFLLSSLGVFASGRKRTNSSLGDVWAQVQKRFPP